MKREYQPRGRRCGRPSNTVDTFLSRIHKTDSCWIWTGTVCGGRYGFFKCNDKLHLAHRFAYALFKGDLSDDQIVMHTCDNTKCVNPDHLIAGTTQDNVNDRVSKNRSAKGCRNYNTRLTPEQVVEIRSTDYSGHGTAAKTARRMGISHTALNYVREGRNHSGVTA